jgi:hypothetical protein
MPLQQRLKLVFDHARAHRGPCAFDAVAAAVGVQIDGELLPLLQPHTHLSVDSSASTLEYRPTFALSSREDVEALLRQHPFGVLSSGARCGPLLLLPALVAL